MVIFYVALHVLIALVKNNNVLEELSNPNMVTGRNRSTNDSGSATGMSETSYELSSGTRSSHQKFLAELDTQDAALTSSGDTRYGTYSHKGSSTHNTPSMPRVPNATQRLSQEDCPNGSRANGTTSPVMASPGWVETIKGYLGAG